MQDSSLDILSGWNLDLVDRLEEVVLSELIIDEVDKFQTTSSKFIEQIAVVDGEVVQSFISNLIFVTLHVNIYVESLKKESIKLTEGMIKIYHHLERMKSQATRRKSPRISQILDMHA